MSALEPDSVGVSAVADADGYLLNGTGLYTGHGSKPDILWTVALVQPESNLDSGQPEPVCLVIDANSEGLAYPPSRMLTATAPTPVSFEDVWVLRTDALGPEGDGHRVLHTRVTLDPRADLPSWVEVRDRRAHRVRSEERTRRRPDSRTGACRGLHRKPGISPAADARFVA